MRSLFSSSSFRKILKKRFSLKLSLILPFLLQTSNQIQPSIFISGDESNSFVFVTGPVSLCEMIMHTFHFLFGLPWLVAPCLTILLFRLLMLPLVIYQFRNLAHFRMISPLYMHLFRSWIRSVFKGDVTGRIAFSKHLRTLTKGTGIHPLKSFISPMLFLPIWWSLLRAVREFLVYFPSLKSSGILWFPDLTAPDPYYLLPALWIAILAFNIWLICPRSYPSNKIKYLFIGLSAVSLFVAGFIAIFLPTFLFALFIPSALVTTCEHLLFGKSRFLRRQLSIPNAPLDYEELEAKYKHKSNPLPFPNHTKSFSTSTGSNTTEINKKK